jgi:DNA-binding MarR family transcriptional regulator
MTVDEGQKAKVYWKHMSSTNRPSEVRPGVRLRRRTKNQRRRRPFRKPPTHKYPNDLELVTATCPGYNLGRAYKMVTRIFEREFRSSNLTLAQFALLVNIGRGEPTTGTEIANRLGSDVSTVSRTLDVVVERGLVWEQRGKDRRVRLYRLTDEGRGALEETLPKWRRAKEATVSQMDQRKWHQTLRQLKELSTLEG